MGRSAHTSRAPTRDDKAGLSQVSALQKVVVLAAGRGQRMRTGGSSMVLDDVQKHMAAQGAKSLIPVGTGRPFLDYLLSSLADAGFRQVCLILGDNHKLFVRYLAENRFQRIRVTTALQRKPLGTAHALISAETFIANDPFLMINSDNYYPADALSTMQQLADSGLPGFQRDAIQSGSNISADRVEKFSVLQVDPEGLLRKIVEKPTQEILSHWERPILVSMNCWRFSPTIFSACRQTSKSPRGEYEIPAAVNCAIEQFSERFHVVPIASPVLDLSSQHDIAPVSNILAQVKVRL